MVLETSTVPFKRTLHSGTLDASKQLAFPFFIDARAAPGSIQQRLELAAPHHSTIAGAEITSLSTTTSSSSAPVVILMQLLDGDGRPSAHPIPLCVLSTSNAFSAKVRVPLNNPQRVNLFALRSDAGVSAVRITGKVVLADGNLQAGTHAKAKMQKWMNTPRSFEAVCKTSAAPSHKRQRSSSSSGEEPPRLIFAAIPGGDDES